MIYTRNELITLSKPELMEIARELGIPSVGFIEDTRRSAWIDAILKASERVSSEPSKRQIKLDNYQPLKTKHIPLYQAVKAKNKDD